MQKRICASVVVLLVGIAMVQNASAYETAIADTTGYTVLSASDTGIQSSIADGAHFGGSISSSKDYLVNNALDIRTPSTASANTTFGGFPQDGKLAPILEKMLGEADPDYAKKPDIKWNFTKFLVGKDGRIVRRFEPTAPLAEVESAIEAELAK